MANARLSLHKSLPRYDRCKGRRSCIIVSFVLVVLSLYTATLYTFVSVQQENRTIQQQSVQREKQSPRKPNDLSRQKKPLLRNATRQTKDQPLRPKTTTNSKAEQKQRPAAPEKQVRQEIDKEEEKKPLVSEIDKVRVVRNEVARNRTTILQETAEDLAAPLDEASPVVPIEPETAIIPVSNAKKPPLKVLITHETRNDLLGSFVAPTLYLHAIARFYNWTLIVLPFIGSPQHDILKNNWELKGEIDQAWGTGFHDANHREDYNPIDLNARVHETLGFFPPLSDPSIRNQEWVRIDDVPAPETLPQVCENATATGECYIWLPDNPHRIQNYMIANGGCDAFFPPDYRKHMRESFLKDKPKPEFYTDGVYNIAIHVRRGDILDPVRWINQTVYASIARHICRNHTGAAVHVFSSGPNRDGNWSVLENITDVCGSVAFHIDEEEFKTWVHMVSADAFILSKSSFSAIPALLTDGDVYFPHDFWHIRLSHFHLFESSLGYLL